MYIVAAIPPHIRRNVGTGNQFEGTGSSVAAEHRLEQKSQKLK